jgi:hypothetical protein
MTILSFDKEDGPIISVMIPPEETIRGEERVLIQTLARFCISFWRWVENQGGRDFVKRT